jgi:short-subunit dehydrogenase
MKTVIITGASAGIGKALAYEFHTQGFNVALVARREDRLKNLAAELNGARAGSCEAYPCDITDKTAVDSVFAKIVTRFGAIDAVIANAGFGIAARVDELQTSDYRTQFDTNVFGLLDCFYASLPALKKSRGSFVALGSANSYLAMPQTSAYCMSKFAVRAFCESAYWELQRDGVCVTLVCPGFIQTEIRKVNNEGKYNSKTKDPIPEWLQMSADAAAKIIYRATVSRKKEVILTMHARVGIFLVRHVPWLLYPMMKIVGKSGLKARSDG